MQNLRSSREALALVARTTYSDGMATDRSALEAQVAAHPFLLGLSDHHVRLLADCAMATTFPAKQMIFRTGEMANRFYLI